MAVPVYVYSTFAFLGFLLVCIPVPWHWHAKNASTCLFMFWTGLGCLNLFINSVIWAHDAINYAPIWCDISSRVILGVNIGVPAASLLINRRLYHIAACTTVTTSRNMTPAQRRRSLLFELGVGIGLPVIQMILEYVVQGHRFDIFEEIGCYPVQYDSYLLIPIVSAWPIIIGFITLSYCVRTIYHFYHRNLNVKELLTFNSDMNKRKYIRLMCLAGIEALCTTPLAIYFLVRNLQTLRPMASWAVVHWRFSVVRQYPSILWRLNPTLVFGLEFTRWAPVACSFIFFIFFGFAEEALKNYRLAYTSVAKRLGYTLATSSTGVTSSSTTDMRAKNFPHLLSGGSMAVPTAAAARKVSSRSDSISSFNLTIVDAGGLLDDANKMTMTSGITTAGFTPTVSTGSGSSPVSPYSRSSTMFSSPTDGSAPSLPEVARPLPTLDITNVTRRSGESSPVRPPRPDSLQLDGANAV